MSGHDPFAVLGLPARFDIDARALRTAWMRAASALHPDAAGAADAAARANEAFRTLGDPISRARALLDARGAPEVDERKMPDGFLLEMVELRERADEAAGDPAALATLRAEAEARRSEALTSISDAFDECAQERGAISTDAAQRVAVALNVVRAFDRMLEQLDREAGAEGA